MKTHRLLLLSTLLTASPLCAQVPPVLRYQGRVAVSGASFDGTGQFKFAFVNPAGTTSYWSNDGTSTAGSQPADAVSLTVAQGLYSVLLGDASLTNMTAVPAGVFANADVRLRVWFNNGVAGFQQLSPDQRIGATGYAMNSASVALSSVYAAPAQWVVAWGENLSGETDVPAGLTDVVQVAAGADHSLARRSGGTLAAWGSNTSGQSTLPVPALTGITWIAAGSAHSLAVKSNGTVAAWGANDYGQTTVPGTATGVTEVAAGERHSMARRSDGTVVVWGDNAFGQTAVPGAAVGISAVAAGTDHCLALTGSGTVIAWGRNDAGQATVPGGLTGVRAIAAGAFHSVALKNDGTVVAWGWDAGGQAAVPAGLSGVVSIAAGYAHSAAVKNDGTVVTWGDNTEGETSVPAFTTSVVAVSSRGRHTLALRAGTVPAGLARLDAANTFLHRQGIGRAATVNMLEVEGPASKSTAGNWSSNSDRRIKTGITPVTGALEKLNQVNPVTLRYTPEYLASHPGIADVPYYNIIAQEFRKVFPDAVKGSGERLPDGSEILQVDTYPAMITALAAVKELHGKVEARDRKIDALEQRLSALEELVRQRP